ncbi:MAG: hypothetical protein Q4D14_03700 [Bacteroidales bacterium]|nr:hypothetical protein [Bacteroidales bacterium]
MSNTNNETATFRINLSEDYSDIIQRQHPTSTKHPRMNNIQRAAQFAPFAALGQLANNNNTPTQPETEETDLFFP